MLDLIWKLILSALINIVELCNIIKQEIQKKALNCIGFSGLNKFNLKKRVDSFQAIRNSIYRIVHYAHNLLLFN
jgi:hypothetical protein